MIALDPNKTHETRTVPIHDFQIIELSKLCQNKNRTDLLFVDGATYLKSSDSRDGWFASGITKSVNEDKSFPADLTPHDLRHTAASIAISAGANVKAVQRMLGHASAAMTLDVYSELFEEDLDKLSSYINIAHSKAISN